jgi:hypothetical protein
MHIPEHGPTPNISDILRERKAMANLRNPDQSTNPSSSVPSSSEYRKTMEEGDEMYYKDIEMEDNQLIRSLSEDKRPKPIT